MKTNVFYSLVLVLLISSAFSAGAQRLSYYTGTIGKYPVEMSLVFPDSEKVSGFYHYIGKTAWLNLDGGRNNAFEFQLSEYPRSGENGIDPKSTGSFKGNFDANGNFSGTWTAANAQSRLPFVLTKDCSGQRGACFHFGSVAASHNMGDHGASAEITYATIDGAAPQVKTAIDTFIFNRLFYDEMFEDSLGVPHAPVFPQFDTIAYRYVRMNSDSDYNMEWDAGCDVTWNGSGVLCLANSIWEYSGGAHGNGFCEYNCFSLADGKLLTEKDIFLAGYQEPLRLKAVEHLDNDPDFIERDSLQLNGNFFITPEGIGYFYNSYEISSYASGPSIAFIPWKEIASWVDPKGPMGWVRKK